MKLLLLPILSITLLTGCGSSNSSASSEPAPEPQMAPYLPPVVVTPEAGEPDVAPYSMPTANG